ncbi:leguminosin proline-rich group669 secreted peptide [Medicago truncatula]|uniref:Leguminosin proline-rich group669 secreted peptide n=1 Tax=Medicago truncatula TaxID=3880 RepID=A0A072V8R1_MEDTR|nr:leguminosin proline-rich group669 secreted peptide [Medicago truncatula]
MSHHLSVLVLFLAIITLTNIAGNPKHQIHAQTDGPIIYQPPTTDLQKSVGLNKHRPRHRKLLYNNPSIYIPGVPHIGNGGDPFHP